tara:strand:+ start:327 stop:503 length:177 start_codon:yes stop_codon:yes gene_type:complete
MAKFNEVRAEKAKNYPKPSRLSKWGGGVVECGSGGEVEFERMEKWGNGGMESRGMEEY